MNPKQAARHIVSVLCPNDLRHEQYLQADIVETCIQQTVVDAIALVDARWKEKQDGWFMELAKSKEREVAPVTLSDGTVAKFVTPECRKEIADLNAEVERLRRVLLRVMNITGGSITDVALVHEIAREALKPQAEKPEQDERQCKST